MVSESFKLFTNAMNEFIAKKKNNPYFACNYKKPLKSNKIKNLL